MTDSFLYLDHAATAYPRHPRVAEAMAAALNIAGSAGRGGHGGARGAERIVGSCRRRLADLFGVPDPEGMILFPSSTAALSTAIAALGTRAGDGPVRLLLGPMEHNAVWRPAVRLAGREGIAHLPADPLGRVDLGALEGFPSEGFAGVVLQHASNVNGMVQPIAEVGAWCAARGLPFIVDGAQAGGLIPVALDRIPGLVAYTCAGHKYLGGPPGVGVAWLAPGFDPEPLWIGGNGVESERPSVPASGPARYECGTQNLPGIAGLEAALHRFDEEPPALRWSRLRMVRAAWRERLAEIRGVELVGEGGESPRTPVISLGIAGREPAEIAAHLEGRLGARCRAGLHCAPLAHAHLGTLPAGTLRIAPGADSTGEACASVAAVLAELTA